MLGDPQAPAVVVDMSGSGVRLKLPHPIPCGAAIKIETDDLLMLGEVIRCEPDGQTCTAGVLISQVLTQLSQLERMNRSLLNYDEERAHHDSWSINEQPR